jgi:hypothetical protein
MTTDKINQVVLLLFVLLLLCSHIKLREREDIHIFIFKLASSAAAALQQQSAERVIQIDKVASYLVI